MKIEYKNYKGVLLVDVNGTHNTLPYSNNNDLLRLIDSCFSKTKLNDIQVIDFKDKSTYLIMDNEDLENVRSEINEKFNRI